MSAPSGHSAALARTVDLIDLLSRPPGELHARYDIEAGTDRLTALRAVLDRHGETDVATEDDLAAMTEVATRLRPVFTAGPDEQAALLNAVLAEHGARPRLSNHAGTGWHVHVDPDDDASWADWFAAGGAFALSLHLAEDGTFGTCAATDCRAVFTHDGRGGPRHYCTPRCATRTRVAAHRARTRP